MAMSVDVAGTGFTVLDRLYEGDDKATEALGGSCGNVLVSLAMLSHSVTPVLALGQDVVGDRLVRAFAEAGADTRYITRRWDISSPVLAQCLDAESGEHWFSFMCPETDVRLPSYTSIAAEDVAQAQAVINQCSVFYADRVSVAILEAMESASAAGALVYFEPSSVDDDALFERALRVTRILKYSADRLGEQVARSDLCSTAISIVTHGASGLEIRQDGVSTWCQAIPASIVRDTCGSGDMVTVGLIDWILDRPDWIASNTAAPSVMGGVIAGQRLAAANCAFAGARGLFQRLGAQTARQILAGQAVVELSQLDLFD